MVIGLRNCWVVVLTLSMAGLPGSVTAQSASIVAPAQVRTASGRAHHDAAHEPPRIGPTITVNPRKGWVPGGHLKIIGYGDTRFTDPVNVTDTNPRMRKFLVDRIAEEAPDALFETGDLPFIGSHPADWANFREETAPWRKAGLRVYPTIGNHEVTYDLDEGIANYLAAFPELGGCRYYSLLLGNVYLLSLDEFSPMGKGSDQRAWLTAQLEHLPPQVDFVFFLDHMPLVNDLQSQVAVGLPEPEETELRVFLEAEKSKTRASFIVLSGHIHNYERFERGGISYIITGGGGAKPYPIFVRGREDRYRDTRFPVFNYVVFQIQRNTRGRDHVPRGGPLRGAAEDGGGRALYA